VAIIQLEPANGFKGTVEIVLLLLAGEFIPIKKKQGLKKVTVSDYDAMA
jgi:hypothetical protein